MKFPMKTPGGSHVDGIHVHLRSNWTEVEPVPDAVGHARRVVRAALTSADPEFGYEVVLVTSELVTNAIRCVRAQERPPGEAPPGVWMDIRDRPRWVHLRVRDSCPALLPAKRAAEVTDTTGRGLAISEAVATLLWVEAGTADKVINAVFAKPGVTLSADEIAGLRG